VLLANSNNKELKSKYKCRAKYLRRGVGLQFVRGHTSAERRVVQILIDLIKGKFTTGPLFLPFNTPLLASRLKQNSAHRRSLRMIDCARCADRMQRVGMAWGRLMNMATPNV
jgi:hypothetical protein